MSAFTLQDTGLECSFHNQNPKIFFVIDAGQTQLLLIWQGAGDSKEKATISQSILSKKLPTTYSDVDYRIITIHCLYTKAMEKLWVLSDNSRYYPQVPRNSG